MILALIFSLFAGTPGFAQHSAISIKTIQQKIAGYESAQALTSGGKSCRSSKECGHGKNCLDTFTGGKCDSHPCGAFYGKCVSGETCSAFGHCCGFICH